MRPNLPFFSPYFLWLVSSTFFTFILFMAFLLGFFVYFFLSSTFLGLEAHGLMKAVSDTTVSRVEEG
jgi:hypothetical protein